MEDDLGAVGVDEDDGPSVLLVGGVLTRKQHHTELVARGPPLTWCSAAASGLEVIADSVVWSMKGPVTEPSLPVVEAVVPSTAGSPPLKTLRVG